MTVDDVWQRSFEAVVFDLDQTLVDSSGVLAAVWSRWLTEFGVTPDPSRSFHGWTSEAVIRLCLPEDRLPEGLARMDFLETTTTDGIVPLPGAVEALTALPTGRWAIGTSGSQPVARARLAAAGLPVPQVLVSASDVAHGKPAPDIFLAAARGLGVEPQDCLVVEDSAAGVQAARAAGMAVLGLLTSTPRDELDCPDVVTDLSAVQWQADGHGVRLQLR